MKTKMKTYKRKAVFCIDGSYSSDSWAVVDVSKFTSSDWVEIDEASDNDRMHIALEIEKSKKRPISKIKQACINYLGNRGITERVKRCAKYKNLWFIQFAGGEDVEVSFEGSCYEPYTDVSLDRMQWTKKFLKSEGEKIIKWEADWKKKDEEKMKEFYLKKYGPQKS